MYSGHVIYDLFYESGDTFSTSEKFTDTNGLFHLTSFTYLINMQELYKVEEVRIAEVYIQGLSMENTNEIVQRMHDMDSPLSDFKLYGEDRLYG